MVTPSDTENLFAEHTPVVWRHYPLMLASMMPRNEPLHASVPGARDLLPALVVGREAPHFQLNKIGRNKLG